MKLQFRRMSGGFRFTLLTTNYSRTIWVNYPHVTKLSRTGSKAHLRWQEKARADSERFWREKHPPKPPPGPPRPNPTIPSP